MYIHINLKEEEELTNFQKLHSTKLSFRMKEAILEASYLDALDSIQESVNIAHEEINTTDYPNSSDHVKQMDRFEKKKVFNAYCKIQKSIENKDPKKVIQLIGELDTFDRALIQFEVNEWCYIYSTINQIKI